MLHTIEQAIQLHQQGRLIDAERLYREVLRVSPRDFEALHRLGVLKAQQGKPDEAVRLIESALAVDRTSVPAYLNCALVLVGAGRHADALAAYDRALAIDPRNASALSMRADTLCDLGRRDEALASYDRAIAADPRLVPALVNRGVLLRELARPEEALASYDHAIAVEPRDAEAWNNRGVVLHELDRIPEALASYERALANQADHVEALFNCGNALLALRRPAEAASRYTRALAQRPDFADACNNMGSALSQLGRFEQAFASYERTLALKPGHIDALVNRAGMLEKLGRHQEAIAAYERLRALRPEPPTVLDGLLRCRMSICQWSGMEALSRDLVAAAVDGSATVDPFDLLAFDTTPAEQLACGRHWVREKKLKHIFRQWDKAAFSGDRIRVAYVSADFHQHVTANVMAELFELQDRTRFELIGISFGQDDRSPMRSRLTRAFDRFFDVSTRTDGDIAKLIRELGAHIALDLKGHTQDARIGIFAQRAAPIQVGHIGFPATTGADFIDYIIADRFVLPLEHEPFFDEKIVHLPECYHLRDCTQRVAPTIPSRGAVGLPERGFVFCCFNNGWKINPRMFDIWGRLLAAVEGSVLWLFSSNEHAIANLRKEIAARGIDPDRLVFAPHRDLSDHLARVTLADLFLDTLPYNAHTTASDALWAGVPVVTCTGPAFAGRVATSMLHAVGLPELVTTTPEDYEALARKLAGDAPLLRSIRARLEPNRPRCPLFDTARFARHLESAYATMVDMWRRGEAARAFSVSPIDSPRA